MMKRGGGTSTGTSTAAPGTCGDGIQDDAELCDGNDLGGQTCQTLGFMFDCNTLGFNSGTLACDNCVYAGCSDAFIEDFEAGSSLGAGWTTTSPAWFVSSSTVHAGSSISFWHTESTESGFDYLQFYVDGGLQGEWSGLNSWSQNTYNITEGAHTLEWRYFKDGSLDDGSDTVWVDDIVAVNGF
jgi:hypothetical protein